MIKLNTIAGLEHVKDYYYIENDVIYSTFWGELRVKSQRDKKGYLYVNLMTTKSLHSIDFRVNRIVAIVYIPRIKGCNIVHHKDGNKKNNSINNLEWTTNRKNTILSSKSADLYKSQEMFWDEYTYLTDDEDESMFVNGDIFMGAKKPKKKNIVIANNIEYEQLSFVDLQRI